MAKSGMYGETPQLKIGKLVISKMEENPKSDSFWIEDTDSGEGGEFSGTALCEAIEEFFNAHF